MNLDFEIVDLETRACLSVPTITQLSNLAKTQARWIPIVFSELQAQGITPTGPPFVRYSSYEPEKIVLEIGWPIADHVSVITGEKSRVWTLPGGRFVSTVYSGALETMDPLFERAREWLTARGLQAARGWTEYCLTDPAEETNPERWRTQILIPIRSQNKRATI